MNIEDIKKKLFEYFVLDSCEVTETEEHILRILDEGSITSLSRGGYTGVTIPYIKQYVLKKEIPDNILFFVLGILMAEKHIAIIYCPNIYKLVVENYNKRERSFETSYERLNKAFNMYNV